MVQAQWITDGLRLAGELPSVHAVGWIHLYISMTNEPTRVLRGLIESDGVEKSGVGGLEGGLNPSCVLMYSPNFVISAGSAIHEQWI